jgi:hypothetical protein
MWCYWPSWYWPSFCHSALDLSCLIYQAVRRELAARRTFFNDLRALTRYLYFANWQQLLTFMYRDDSTLLRSPVRAPIPTH